MGCCREGTRLHFCAAERKLRHAQNWLHKMNMDLGNCGSYAKVEAVKHMFKRCQCSQLPICCGCHC